MRSKLTAVICASILFTACTGGNDQVATLPLTNEERPVEVVTEETTAETTETTVETTAEETVSEETTAEETAAEVFQTPETELTTYLNTLLNAEPAPLSETNASVPDDAKSAFKDLLENEENVYGVVFDDLNADGNAEMIVGINPFGLTDIASWKNGELKTTSIDTVSDHGGTWDICTDGSTHTILNREQFCYNLGAAGYEEWYIYVFDKGSGSPSARYSYLREQYPEVVPDDELANVENYYGDATLNGEPIDESTSNEILSLLIKVSEKYPTFSYIEHCDADGNVTDEFNTYIRKYLG